ncbi:MAG: ADP-glyceromanno-heptose 6-epimerase [Terriglobales bacterium]
MEFAPRSPLILTGAAGFIGSVLAARLAAAGRAVAAVDALGTDQRFQNLAGVPIADYCDRSEFLAALAAGRFGRPSAIVHLGACSDTTETDAAFLLRNNFEYTRSLATWCLEHGVRFVYASSAATYGSGDAGYSDDPALLPRLRPLNAYAFSKHAFDLWALAQGVLSGPGGITGLKYFNVYGPNEYHKGGMRSMVLKACEQIQSDGKVRLFQSHRSGYRDGEQTRDFLYVEDAVAITAWFLDHPEAAGIYNVGSGLARTWNDLAHAVFAAMQRSPQIDYIPMPESLRAGYQYHTCADLSRLRAAGCGLPLRSLEQGVDRYVRDFLRAPDRYYRARCFTTSGSASAATRRGPPETAPSSG